MKRAQSHPAGARPYHALVSAAARSSEVRLFACPELLLAASQRAGFMAGVAVESDSIVYSLRAVEFWRLRPHRQGLFWASISDAVPRHKDNCRFHA